jgi:dolichol-phosphate mannosyltransferase
VTAPIVVLLPAYNEERAIGPLLDRIEAALRGRPYRVVLVDDGSADRTLEVARARAASMPLTILPRPRNGGLGSAMRTGLDYVGRSAAPGDILVTMDADNTHDPRLIPRLVEAIEAGADLIVASRFVPGAVAVGVPRIRRVLSGGARIVFGLLVGAEGVRDYTSGYRAYRVALLHRLAARFRPLVRARGFGVMTELLAKAAAEGARCREVPIMLRYDLKPGRSKLKLWPTLAEYARVVTLARLDAWRTAPRAEPAARLP